MSVYKELGVLVSKLQDGAQFIYHDANDYGYIVNSYDDPIIKEINACKDMYEPEGKTDSYNTGFTRTLIFNPGMAGTVEAGYSDVEIRYVSAPFSESMIDRKTIGYIEVCAWNNPSDLEDADEYHDNQQHIDEYLAKYTDWNGAPYKLDRA